MRRGHWGLAALAGLALVRLVPADGVGLWLRLALALAVLLVPGALVARALGQTGPAATLVWALAAAVLGLGAVFVFHTALWLALVVLGAVALAAFPAAARRLPSLPPRGTVAVMVAGLVFGALLWHVAGALQGDALFHLARMRKLGSLGDLHLGSVNEFRDGSLHPGYAFPLWHGFLALVAKLAGVDPAAVVLHAPSVLAPLALGVAYEAGVRVFDSIAAGFAALLAQVGLIALAPGHGGAYVFLTLPPTASRQLLVPAVLALAFAAVPDAPGGQATDCYKETHRWGTGWQATVCYLRKLAPWAAVSAGGAALALMHPTYAVFLCIPLAGYAVARTVLARGDLVHAWAPLGALAAPTLAVALWVHSLARNAASFTPDAVERRRALRHYARDLDVFSPDRYRVDPGLLSRGGAVAVAALMLVPLAFLGAPRRSGALVLGGSLAVLLTVLPSFVFPHLADVVSLSQARRAAGFVPFSLAFAGGMIVLASLCGLALLPLALGAGIGLQLAWPGDFGYGLREGGPTLAAWVALWGGLAALALLAVWRPRHQLRRHALAPLAALLFVTPVAVHGFAHWSPRDASHRYDLTPGLVEALRGLPRGEIVYADAETSYRIAAYAPLYVAVSPPFHVADTRGNRRLERIRDLHRFLRTGDPSIPRRYGARYVVLRGDEETIDGPRSVLYQGGGFALVHLL